MNPLDIFKDTKKIEITNQLKKLGITKDFTINKDYTVDLNKDVAILAKKLDKSPVKFNIAHGNFIWHYSNLKSVENFPLRVYGNLSIVGNKIKSLENCPTNVVNGTFNCSGNDIKTLKGSPRKCGAFIASSCNLNTLVGGPMDVNGDYIVSKNKLTSLKGSPKEISGTFDCSDNDLKTLDFLPKCKKSITIGNSLENFDIDSTQIHIDFNNFKLKDKVVYSKQGSKFTNLIGEIVEILEPITLPERVFQIYFKKSENPTLDRDSTVSNIRGKFLTEYTPVFYVGDTVIYNNPNSKYKGYVGKIDDKDMSGDEPLYKVKFIYDENPGIVDIVSPGNKNKTFVNVGKMKANELIKVHSDRKIEDEKIEDKKEVPSVNYIIKDPSNTWNVGDQAMIYGEKVDIIELVSPVVWTVKPSIGYRLPYSTHYTNLKKVTTVFTYTDKIIYLDPGGEYDECKGQILSINWADNKQYMDIRIDDKFGISKTLYSVPAIKLERIVSSEKIPVKSKGKFKKGDKVIYISKTSDDKNKDLHLCKGEVYFENTYSSVGTYDVKFPKQVNNPYERNVFLIHSDNLILDKEEFKVGDKVLYNNESDKDFNGHVGIITKLDKDKYVVVFNDGETTMSISEIEPSDLTKFIKPIGTEVHINDTIIYTKPNSKHYGCKGTVVDYKIDNKKPFEIEIISRDKKLIKISTTDENLEYVQPPRIFKKGDIIRYINSDNPVHDGLIGTVTDVIDEGKSKKYDVTLKRDTSGSIIYLTTHGEFLLLLEEAADSDTIKYGQKVKYSNPNSKYNNKVGEFQGERIKDGKKQYCLKFDEGNIFKTIYFDENEGVMTPTGDPVKTTTNTTTTTNVTYTTPKKKKKKEEEPERPPVLVYNRRNVARMKYKKPGEVEYKFKVGDKVSITTKFSNLKSDKGEIVELPSASNEDKDKYVVSVGDKTYWMGENDMESSDEIEIGDTVTILDTATKSEVGKKGIVKSLKNFQNRYIIAIDNTTLHLLRNQFEKD